MRVRRNIKWTKGGKEIPLQLSRDSCACQKTFQQTAYSRVREPASSGVSASSEVRCVAATELTLELAIRLVQKNMPIEATKQAS